jgi:hypothetical protein
MLIAILTQLLGGQIAICSKGLQTKLTGDPNSIRFAAQQGTRNFSHGDKAW